MGFRTATHNRYCSSRRLQIICQYATQSDATHKDDKTLPEKIEPIDVANIETLDRVINSQVRPPIVGLKKRVIDNKVMILEVPESESPPHQSLYDKRYYRRSGTENVPMEHDLIALKFGRKSAPVIGLHFEPVQAPVPNPELPSSVDQGFLRVYVVTEGRRAGAARS